MFPGSRPRRESAKLAEEKIAAVFEWENCSENSEQFLKVAEQFEKEFEREGFLRLRKCEEGEMSGDKEDEESEYDEEEEEESEDYESSFVDDSEDEFAGSGDEEWRPPNKRQKRDEQKDKEEDEEERQFIEDLNEADRGDEQLEATYSYDAPQDMTSSTMPPGYVHYMCTEIDDGDGTESALRNDDPADYTAEPGTFLFEPTLSLESDAEVREAPDQTPL